MREVITAADREVTIIDPLTGQRRSMLMFGSNNYLGLANHPYVREQVRRATVAYGVGIGGPPLLNGYTALHRELEERLAALKGKEDALIFSSGYGANVGVVTAIAHGTDRVFYDAYSHASFCDGIKMAGVPSFRFSHNNSGELQKLFEGGNRPHHGETYVGVEGVYSMDGDLAPLDEIVPLCKSHGAVLLVDDAHGTGVMGRNGRGTAEHFDVERDVDITIGTFSKTFAVTGGFVAGPKALIDYLRYFARSYMFSASLPPVVVAAVLAGLDVMECEPGLLADLRENVEYTVAGLQRLGFDLRSRSGIIPLRVPEGMDIRHAAYKFHERGIFVNSIEYPAVPISQQRFRISLIATHTKADIDRLLDAVEEVWSEELEGVERDRRQVAA